MPNQTKPIVTGPSQKVLHVAASDLYKRFLTCKSIFTCDICLCLNRDKIMQGTYLTMYENKLEWNQPFQLCCCNCDNHGLLYFDRDITTQVQRAGFCSPCCTHCSFCPTCFDVCGEALIVSGGTICSPSQAYTTQTYVTCIKPWICICGYENTDAIAANIMNARSKAASMAMAPMQMTMQPMQTGQPSAPQKAW
eukprot:Colp12_sorted_trinity150504_noHs@14954